MPSATLYDIRHVTVYEYRSPAPSARCVIRLTPTDRPGQQVLTSKVEFEPKPEEVTADQDSFGNAILRVAFHKPHARLTIRAVARVAVDTAPPEADPAAIRTPAWETLAETVLAERRIGGLAPVEFLFASRLVPLSDPITAYAQRSFSPGRPVLWGALDLTKRIRRDFAYDPTATNVATPVATAFAARRGVCQDFAHVMIAGLRALGIPAAYVSGYLRTVPPPGQPRLEGADAMHAWVAVWCGGEVGWIGLDPTNAMAAGPSHIVVAIGRDYADVSPVDGVVVTSGPQGMRVAVDVIEVPRDDRARQTAPAASASISPA